MESMEKDFKELLEKKRSEIQAGVDKNIKKYRARYLIIELIVGIIGYGLIIYNFSFLLALGVWFAIWSNNMGMTRTYHKGKNKEINQEIWKE